VHSSNAGITWLPTGPRRRYITGLFHAQLPDFTGYSRVGTFFTNLCRGLVFTGLRASDACDSTDLSTTRVDKPESPFASDSCVIYVMVTEGMARNFKPLPPVGSGAQSESGSGTTKRARCDGIFSSRRQADAR